MKIKSIDVTVTPWDANIKMLSTKNIKIERPLSVTVEEWLDFWRHRYAETVRTSEHFTWEDAQANTERRLKAIAENRY
jgi:hypothetical protein